MIKNTIVLVDDDFDLSMAMKEMFELIISESKYKNLKTVYFNDPILALKFILDNIKQICLIVSDENMPPSQVKGGEMLTYIYELCNFYDLPLATLYASEADIVLKKYPKLIDWVEAMNKPAYLTKIKSLMQRVFDILPAYCIGDTNEKIACSVC